ncbi:MAG: glycosyltransferase family 4 protein [Bacteroidales bacterium]|nr:glycosyltransferase family 4 protein [Bacteroidales bacterium]
MKKVLVITYYWPPSGGGGVQRWLKFVKYLKRFDWEPIVFTPSNPEIPSEDLSLLDEVPKDIRVIRNKIWEPYTFYKQFTGRKKEDKIQTAFLTEKKGKFHFLENIAVWIRGNMFIPDARKYWIRPSVKLLSEFLISHKVDAVVTTGPPHSTHLIGLHLKEKLGIRWLADFRDPWTNIDYYQALKLGPRADKLHHKLEKMVLEQADAVTVISPGMKREFQEIVNREYEVIPNGFDEEDTMPQQNIEIDRNHFTLAHIGSLTKTRNAENLWKVLNELATENGDFAKKLEIKNVGKIDMDAVASLRNHGMESYLNRVDYMPHQEVIAEQMKASVLILLINNTPNSKLILTGKIFEYLASGRPIICIGPPDGDAAEVIRLTKSGSVFDFDETENLKTEILRLFDEFSSGKVTPRNKDVQQFERKNLTSKMAGVLDKIMESEPGK